MILIMAMGFVGLVVLAICLFILIKKKSTKPTATVAKDGSVPASAGLLKDEVPVVQATVVGEKAADVVKTAYFPSVYPGVQVITKPQGTKVALPANTPTFLLLTDKSGTITGVDASKAVWSAPA